MAGSGKIANLSIGVGVDTSGVTSGFNKAQAVAENFARKMDTQSIAIGTAIGQNLGEAAREIALAFPRAFSAAADALDSFNDLRDTTGASIENISALDAIGRRTGATFEDLSGALVKFNKTLGEAGDNTKGDIFRELGLDLQKLKQMDPAEAFQETAKAVTGLANNQQRAQLYLELFGKSAATIAPILQDVADAGTLVATATEADAAAAEEYNKALYRFQAASQDAVRALASDLMPALTEIVNAMNTGGEATKVFGDIAKTVFQTVAVVGSDVGFVFLSVGREIGAWAAQLTALASGDLQGFHAISDAVKKDGERARLELDAFQRRVMNAGKSLADMGVPEASYSNEGRGRTPKGDTVDVDKLEADRKARDKAEADRKAAADRAAQDAKRAEAAAAQYIDRLNQQIKKEQDLTEVEKVLADIQAGRVKFQNAAQAGAAVDAAQRLQSLKDQEAAEKSAAESANRLRQAQQQVRQEAAAIYEETRTPQEQYAERLERLSELFNAGAIGADTWGRAVAKAGEDLKTATEKTDELSVAAKRAQENIQDALGDLLEDGLSGNFDNIAQNFLRMLQKMVAQAAAADLMAQITGKGSSNNTAALVGGLVNLFGGGSNTGFGTGSSYGNMDYGAFLAEGTNKVPYDGFRAVDRKSVV